MSHGSGKTPAILFVCTGNTCRSPMAEGILRRRLEERDGAARRVGSAGTFAIDGCRANPLAVAVCREHGLDIAGHRSRLLTREIVEEAGLVLAMEPGHLSRAVELGGAGKTHLLSTFPRGEAGGDDGIEDPAGGGRSEYEAVYDRLEREIERIAGYLVDEEKGTG